MKTMKTMKTAKPWVFAMLSIVFFMRVPPIYSQGEKTEQWKAEIYEIERQFQEMTEEKGIAGAFKFYAAEDAVINRNEQLVEGREAIFNYYNTPLYAKARVNWKPHKVTVAASGDLAYSYGNYEWISFDDTGNEQRLTGVYMTVWQRQPSGVWRFVWD